jgi:DNA invertase Pin-like site-specific DNA recombinase
MQDARGRLAGIYTRISSDPNGQALGVQRQEDDARKLCAARGWTVVEAYCDNDRSAYSQRKQRPRYKAMLDDIKDGKINVVVAWHPDRLHRQTRELVPFIDLVNTHGVHVETVTAGVYDLSTPSGRMQARIVGSVAEYESEHKGERIRRKLEANAAEGKHHGGSRPYGWLNDRVTIAPEEAAAIRTSTAMLLGGQSVKAIARALNAEGHVTSLGRPWRDVTVRGMLMRPRNAGLRVHHGEIVGAGKWEPIISADEFYQVKAILANPERRTTPGRNGLVHLLSVIARCGVCDAGVTVTKSRPYKGVSRRVYRCPRRVHIIRDQESVDDLVTQVILARLSRPDARELLVRPTRSDKTEAAVREAQELQDRLHDAAEGYAAGAITMAQLTTINAAIKPKLEKAQAEAASPSRAKVIGDLVASRDPREVWERISPDQRRAVVALLVDVKIMPTHHGPPFDPDAIKITWRRS